MYRFLSAILLILILCVSSVLLLLFTNSGNAFIKPYVGRYISKELKSDIYIDSLTLKPNFLDLEMIVDKNSRVILNGDINIWKKWFDLDFSVLAKDIKTKYTSIEGSVDIRGKIKGNIEKIKIAGQGKLFNAKVKFDSTVEELKAKNLHLFIDKLRIGKLLSLLNKPPYIFGVANIDINFDNLDVNNLKGIAHIDIPYGSINSNLIKKDLNITLPKGVIFKAKDYSVLKDKNIVSSVDFSSNILNLKTTDTKFSIESKNFYSDYNLKIPRLSLLKSMTNYKLRGQFEANGEIKKEAKDISYQLISSSLGGTLKVTVLNKIVDIEGMSLRLDKILYGLNLPKYSYGDISIKSTLHNLSTPNATGNAKIKLDNASINQKLFLKDFNITVPDDFKYSIILNALQKDRTIEIDSDINSTVANAKIYDASVNNKTIKGRYDINISDLGKLKFLTKKEISGSAESNGSFEMVDKILVVDGNSDIFGTDTLYEYKNGDIKITSKNINTLNLLASLKYPPLFDSNASFQGYYNPKWKKGVFTAILKDGRMVRNELSDTIFTLTAFDLTKELYKQGIIRGNMKDNRVYFNSDLNSTNTSIKIYSAMYDIKSKQINAPFVIKIKDKDVEGEITGDIDHPKVKINSSSYIKNKIEKVIDKKVPEKYREPLKQILNLFGR